MGRIKSSIPTGKFILRKDQSTNERGEYPIYVLYIVDRKVAKVETGLFVKEKDWNPNTGRVRLNHPLASVLNKALDKKLDDYDAQIVEVSQTERITIDLLRKILQGTLKKKEVGNVDFIKLTKEVIETRYHTDKNGIAVRDNALCSLHIFKQFLLDTRTEDTIYVSELTEQLFDDYVFWRKRTRGNQNETINKALTPLMRGVHAAAVRGLIPMNFAELIKGKYLSIKKKRTEEDLEDENVRYLTEDQMKKLLELREQSKYPRTKDYIDMFLFSFHACGLRFSDIMTLQWSHIDFENRKLKKVLFKGSNTVHEIPLTQSAIDLLEQWKEKGGKRFVFGLLRDDFDMSDVEELKRQRINRNTPVKVSLRTLGDKLGLPFSLTIHVARHSFAVAALNRGVDVHMVSRLLGHSSVLVTEKVYAKFLPSTIEKAVQDKLNFDF